ncbi:MAG: type II and III secretion system protein family protein [Pseudomonadota bacterium]
MTTFKKLARHARTMLAAATLTVLTSAAITALPIVATEAKAANSVIQIGNRGGRTETVVLGLDKSIVLELPADAHDILVANPNVADAVSRTARRIYLFGRNVGNTNIFVFDKAGNQVVALDLQVERDVSGLDRYLGRFIPRSNIKTEIINDNIVLTGTVETPQDAAKAAQLAEIFVRGGERANNTAGSFSFFRFGGSTSQIVNLLDIAGGDQVTLKVTVAEIQRSVLKQLGINVIGSRSGNNGITFGGVSNSLVAPSTPPGSTGFNLGGMIGGLQIDAYVRAMEEAGVMKALATPTLTAVSGERAQFRVGGSVNTAAGTDASGNVVQGDTIGFGVDLSFTPVVLSPGRISLQVRTSVSEPVANNSGGLTAAQGGLTLRERLADTTVELPSGGSMVIAGLIQDDVRQVVTGMPGLSKLPVLGALFRSREYVRNETELVIMVTPYLVRPVAESSIALPTDNFAPPSDRAGNLLGRVNRIYGSADKNLPDGRYHGAVGFIYK